MVAVNPPGPTAYGPTAGPINPDNTPIVDTVDTVPIVGPSLTASGLLAVTAPFNPLIPPDTAGIPGNLGLLIEMRVANYLTALLLGTGAPDLEQMRANELFKITIGTGTVGGDGN